MASGTWAVREKLDRADSATRHTLLAAARRVFETKGFALATIADITREAGVGRATFYVYFADKEEVFAVLAHQVRDRLVEAQELTGLDPDDPWAVAAATTTAYLDAYADNLSFLTVLDHQAIADPAMAELREEIHALPMKRGGRYIRRLAERGLADPAADPDTVSLGGGGLVAALAPVLARHPERRDQIRADLTRMYLRLLGLPPEKPAGRR
ncbi:TetR/AcrR family transcriptional regulator [Amycolatopsis echigonensis]|nr:MULTISPECIES: TetR/AcrR family transcriptional regulator [Amycolatopsis]PKV96022.1 TetR family transcriptional regulator [Amycolatopsis niigatensis]